MASLVSPKHRALVTVYLLYFSRLIAGIQANEHSVVVLENAGKALQEGGSFVSMEVPFLQSVLY